MRRLIVRQRVYDDLDDLTRHIAGDSPDAAARLAQSVFDIMDRVVFRPEAYPELVIAAENGQRYRKVAPPGFPNHLIIHRVTPATVEVHRVLHGSRDLPSALRGEVPD